MTMAEEMWALVPSVYRRRDADSSDVLRALIEVIAEQADVIRDDIARSYDNLFIETCDEWVVPYIGDLVGAARGRDPAPGRMLVANTLRWRRRKGAFALLDQIAWDVARWPAQAVEFGRGLAMNQDLRFVTGEGGLADLHDPARLALIGGPADPLPRSIDVRDAAAQRSPGRYGASNVGLFVFRSSIVQVAHVDAAAIDDEGSGRFTFDPLGRDVALHHPSPAGSLQDPPGLPGPITRGRLAVRRSDDHARGPGWTADPALYGEDGCTHIWEQRDEGEPFRPVAPDRIMPANLHRWRDRPSGDFVALDPELGRIAFADRIAPRRVRVSYAYAATGAVGAPAPLGSDGDGGFDKVHLVAKTHEEAHHELRTALDQWRKDPAPSTLIELRDSATYDEDRLVIDFSHMARRLVIRAAPGCRPIIRLADREGGALDGWRVRGGRDGVAGPAGASLKLEGLTIAQHGLLIDTFAGELILRNCTLVPGWGVQADGSRGSHEAMSLTFENCSGSVHIARTILGPVFARADEHIEAPLALEIVDSIIDAGHDHATLTAPDSIPYVELSARRSTFIGSATAHAVGLVENSIFTHPLRVARRQKGCVRFCFLPPGSRTPRSFACLPGPDDDPALAPAFVSRACGAPGYAQLARVTDGRFQHGADDHGELGAYHDLFWTHRESSLRETLSEYAPAAANVGIIYLA